MTEPNKKISWELINNISFGWTERAKIPGGWLVRTCGVSDALPTADVNNFQIPSMALSICFVPDPNHEWR